jgi:hypothetical protein
MPRNVDPTLSSTEETEAIKTAALIAARLEFLPSEGLRGLKPFSRCCNLVYENLGIQILH